MSQDLVDKINELELQNKNLLKVIEILAQKPFNDCFNYICQSRNECQTFGCKVQKRIKEIRKTINE